MTALLAITVIVAGGLGALLRYGLTLALPRREPFPVAISSSHQPPAPALELSSLRPSSWTLSKECRLVWS